MKSAVRPVDMLGLGARGLAARPARAVLTAVGIAIGIAAIVAVIGISASGRADLIRTLDRLGTNLLRVTPGSGILGGGGEVPEEARVMASRIGPVDSATQVTAVDATVRRNDLIEELETGGIGVFAARTDLAGELGADMPPGASSTPPPSSSRRWCSATSPPSGSASPVSIRRPGCSWATPGSP